MPVSDAKRKADAKWDKANRTMLGCKVYRDKAEAFKALCLKNETTMNAIFTAAMDSFMREHGVDPDQFSRKKD